MVSLCKANVVTKGEGGNCNFNVELLKSQFLKFLKLGNINKKILIYLYIELTWLNK